MQSKQNQETFEIPPVEVDIMEVFRVSLPLKVGISLPIQRVTGLLTPKWRRTDVMNGLESLCEKQFLKVDGNWVSLLKKGFDYLNSLNS